MVWTGKQIRVVGILSEINKRMRWVGHFKDTSDKLSIVLTNGCPRGLSSILVVV